MLRISVFTPPEYNLSDEEINKRVQHYEEITHKVENKLGKYCEVFYTFDGLTRPDIEEGKDEYMSDCLIDIRLADYVVFADDWQSSKECLKQHKIAEALEIPILDFTEGEINP